MAIKKVVGFITVSLTISPVWALDFVVQPRIDAGIIDYRLELEPVSQRSFTPDFDIGQTSNALLGAFDAQGPTDVETTINRTGFRVDDTLPFVNLGVTLFTDRWYADLSYLRAFDGKARVNDQQSVDFNVFSQGATVLGDVPFSRYSESIRADLDATADFDREEFNFTIGYAVTEQFAVFGGFRRSTTDLEARRRGNYSERYLLTSGDAVLLDSRLDAIYSDFSQTDFRQQGPFIGTAYTIPVDGNTLHGAINFNAAVSFLDAKLKSSINDSNFSDVSLVNNLTGEALPINDFPSPPVIEDFTGDAVGISLGVAWRGLTPVEGLTYGIGVNAYDYQFKSDRSDVGNISERAIRYQLGVAYQF